MKYIIGLGNPGSSYEYTRHNVGFLVVSHIAHECNFSEWKKDKYLNAEIAVGKIGSVEYTLIKPQTFMNLSGDVVRVLIEKNSSSEDIIVIYDDLAFPFGVVRLAHEKGDGGHNGIKSISGVLVDKKYLRVRIGIHSYIPELQPPTLVPLTGVDRADFVLKEFRKDEQLEILNIVGSVILIIKNIETQGLAKTMTEINQRLKNESAVSSEVE